MGRAQHCGKSDTVRFVFDSLNVGNSNPCSKTNAEVTPTDVYIIRSRSVPRANYALTHTFGCIVYIPPGGIKSVRSKEKAVVGPNVRTGSRRYPRFILHSGKANSCFYFLTLGYQSDHLLLTDAR